MKIQKRLTFRLANIAILGIALVFLQACSTTTERPSDDEAAKLYEIIGELIVNIDTTSSHANGPDAFGAGPVSTRYENFYIQDVASMSEARRVEYFWAGMRHFRFQGGTMDLFLDVVSNDSAVGMFKERLKTYIETAEEIGRVTSGVSNARKVLVALERRSK